MENEEFDLKYIVKMSEKLEDENLNILLTKMSSYFTGSKFNELCDFMNNSDVENREKTIFLLRATSVVDINDTKNRDFNLEYIPYFLEVCIRSDKEDFVNLVTQDSKMQELLVEYIKKFPGSAMIIWPKISNLPLVKERILEDEVFVVDTLANELEFFIGLPEEYAHFICFYKAKNTKMDIEFMKSLYQKHYGDVLSEIDQLYLIHWQLILEEQNSMNINSRIIREPIEFGLRKLKEDKSFLKLKDKLQVKIFELMQLAFNYRNSSLYNELIALNEIDEELVKKLRVLSSGRKIIGIYTLEDLRNTTLDELTKMEREPIQAEDISNTIRPNTGGPSSRTFKPVFSDSKDKEIRRINPDGSVKIETLNSIGERHETIFERAYKGELELPEDCDTVFQRAIEAIKQLSTVTLVIEKEQCSIYLPENLSAEQKRVILELIYSAEEEGRFGIVSYNTQTGKVAFPYDGKDVEKALAINVVSKFGRDINHGLNNSEQKQSPYEDDER